MSPCERWCPADRGAGFKRVPHCFTECLTYLLIKHRTAEHEPAPARYRSYLTPVMQQPRALLLNND